MLTTPDNLLFLHLLDDDLQDKLLHHLSQVGGEADQPVVPWVLLVVLLNCLSQPTSSTFCPFLIPVPLGGKGRGERMAV